MYIFNIEGRYFKHTKQYSFLISKRNQILYTFMEIKTHNGRFYGQ
jgi:hypothetical protein